MKKNIILICIIVLLSFEICFSNGKWEINALGTKYALDDGSYYISVTTWIDSDNDGVAECYSFDNNGYILKDYVDNNGQYYNHLGQLTIDGVIQQKIIKDITNEKNIHYINAQKNVDDLMNKFNKSANELLNSFLHEIKNLNKFDKDRIYKQYEDKLNQLYSATNAQRSIQVLKHKISSEDAKKWNDDFKLDYENFKIRLKEQAGIK